MGIESIIKGFSGELKTKFIDWLILSDEFTVFNNIIIPGYNGTTQIDHIAVSKYGIFVIETKEKTGWIFGDSHQKEWTQSIFGKRYKFENPLNQNYGHTKSLSELINIDHSKFHSLIIFWGDCEFKTRMPENVIKGDIFNTKFKQYVQNKNTTLLSPDEISKACSQLKLAKENSGLLSSIRHAIETKAKHDTFLYCPRCGGRLTKRVPRNNDLKPFMGCSNYPRCKYIKEI